MDDFREILMVFEGWVVQGFNGFSSGDAGIYEEIGVMESASPRAQQGIELTMQYGNYDGADEKWLQVVIFADEFSVIDPKRGSEQPSATVQ